MLQRRVIRFICDTTNVIPCRCPKIDATYEAALRKKATAVDYEEEC